jgi:hypothetical protein
MLCPYQHRANAFFPAKKEVYQLSVIWIQNLGEYEAGLLNKRSRLDAGLSLTKFIKLVGSKHHLSST